MEKERDTFVQTTEEQKQKNQEKLQYLRAASDDLRKEVAFHRSGGKHVVSKIFVTRPKEKPLMKDKDLKTAAMLMDQKAFEASRSLAKLNYDLQKAQHKLALKQEELADLKHLLDNNPADVRIKEFLELQSKAELVKMKYVDAVNTGNYYKKIIHSLKKEIFDTSQQIKNLTDVKEQKVNIVNDLSNIKDGAIKEYKTVQSKMKPLQTMIETQTRENDEVLRKKKKEYTDQRRDTNAKCMGELKMDTVEDDNPEERKRKELETNLELKNYQDIFEELKEALDISDVKDVLSRVQEEHARYRRLCSQLDECNSMYDQHCDDLDDLREELANLTYHPEPPSMTEQEEADLQKEADQQMERVQNAVSKLRDKEKVIAGIKLATVAIHSKLLYIRLPQNQQSTLVGDPVKDMELIWTKAEKLRAQFESWNMEEEVHDKKEVQKYMEMRLPEDNLRTTLPSLDYRSRDNLRYDFDDVQASYVSREDIKRRHQEILKPKKRKPAGRKSASGRGSKK
ncbi:uncharacterized protein LOC143289399 [Babylonia areolata]|uniref:uncharacterized protein LOC143289399 n=1 Tax=Babylonia areolata TaxID=304850 RepID=UPI003FD6400D